MKFPLFAAAAMVFTLHAHAQSTVPDRVHPVQVFYQPITQPFSSSAERHLLASIECNLSTLETKVLSYSPPPTSDGANNDQKTQPLFRISTQQSDGSTTISGLSTFNPAYTQTLTIHLDGKDSAFAASLSAADPLPPPSRSNSPESNLAVILLRPATGPTPKLNAKKPVVLNADGKEIPQVPEVEKSFFQKYWWAFALIAVLALSGSGDR